MLTRRQRQAYTFIAGFVARNCRTPTYKEIADAMGLACASSGYRVVVLLIERGFLRRRPRGYDLGRRREFYALGKDGPNGWPRLRFVGQWPAPEDRSHAA